MQGNRHNSNPHIPGHNSNRHLTASEIECNVGGLPVTDARLRKLFDRFDVDKSGFLEFNEVKNLYRHFDNFGVEEVWSAPASWLRERGVMPKGTYDDYIESQIKKYAIRDDGKVDYDEFCCIILSVAGR
eukprot:TRINITY_DN7755_c0_g1_i3.p2 TRINITY_DN7755_c0_g1~~TRINITY_DN7755_c0_g1_i3.p2  ORF type:complete len:129 (+),score=17.66 TRINITY_DN7755_c0_g1_i3:180-566(+)